MKNADPLADYLFILAQKNKKVKKSCEPFGSQFCFYSQRKTLKAIAYKTIIQIPITPICGNSCQSS